MPETYRVEMKGISKSFGGVNAVSDVTIKVRQGEIHALAGENGAGKSTLLKILSQITEPTTGTADINGRVGSLLEVGTGFHPELTGRDLAALEGFDRVLLENPHNHSALLGRARTLLRNGELAAAEQAARRALAAAAIIVLGIWIQQRAR